MLHATNAIENVVLGVNSTTQVSLLIWYALGVSILVLVSDGSRWTSLNLLATRMLSRLWHRIEVILDWIITSRSNLHLRHFTILSCVFSLLLNKLLLLLHDDTLTLVLEGYGWSGRVHIIILFDLKWLIVILSWVGHDFLNLTVVRHTILSCHLSETYFAAKAILAADVATSGERLHVLLVDVIGTQVALWARLAKIWNYSGWSWRIILLL